MMCINSVGVMYECTDYSYLYINPMASQIAYLAAVSISKKV